MIKILVALANTFYSTFVFLKIYQWYSPEVGFYMPTLDYVQMFAVVMILRILRGVDLSVSHVILSRGLKDMGLQESKEYKFQELIAAPVACTIILFISWLFYLLLF